MGIIFYLATSLKHQDSLLMKKVLVLAACFVSGMAVSAQTTNQQQEKRINTAQNDVAGQPVQQAEQRIQQTGGQPGDSGRVFRKVTSSLREAGQQPNATQEDTKLQQANPSAPETESKIDKRSPDRVAAPVRTVEAPR